MEKKTVLILGGGIGGQVLADRLGKSLGGRHRIVLVEKNGSLAYSPSFLWLMLGQRRPEDIQRPLSALAKKGVEVMEAEVSRIDAVGKTVETSAGRVPFDQLVIALGAELAPEKVPGFKEAALNLYDLEGAVNIRTALESFGGGRVAVLVSSSPFKCPAAPYETAFLVEDYLRAKGVSAEVSVFTPEPYPMPTAGPKVGEALKAMLEARGIRFHPGRKIAGIDAADKGLAFENGSKAGFDLLIGVPPHQAPKAVRVSGLTNESGWIPVDPGTLATKHGGVYALGDVAAAPIAGGKALPKAGVFAHHQAEVVARNIAAALEGRAAEARFDGHGWCAIELGGGAAGFGSGDFYAPEGPQVRLHSPTRYWHWGKVLFEKWWLWRWF